MCSHITRLNKYCFWLRKEPKKYMSCCMSLCPCVHHSAFCIIIKRNPIVWQRKLKQKKTLINFSSRRWGMFVKNMHNSCPFDEWIKTSKLVSFSCFLVTEITTELIHFMNSYCGYLQTRFPSNVVRLFSNCSVLDIDNDLHSLL